MQNIEELNRKIEKLTKERNAYAKALSLSNTAFMEKVKEFSIVKRITESISWSLDKRQICTELVDLIIDETTAENCSLWLVDPPVEHIFLAAVSGQANAQPKYFLDDASEHKKMKLGKGAAGWVAQHGESLLIEDVSKSPLFIQQKSEGIFIKSLLCLPVKGKDNVIGVLNMSHPDIGAFSKENERVLRLITDQAGIVLTNLQLFEETQRFNKELERRVEERTLNLRLSEERYERAIYAGKVGIWDWQAGSRVMYAAPNLMALLGRPTQDEAPIHAREWLRLIHPADRKRFLKSLAERLRGLETPYEGEHRMRHRDGRMMWFFVRGAVVRDDYGRVQRISGSNTDITKRKLAELELEKAQEEALLHARAAGRVEFANTILHNIGNVLNSVNVNATEVRRIIKRFRLQRLQRALGMIEERQDDLAGFLIQDEKGRQLRAYLSKVSELISGESDHLQDLTEQINGKVELMRDIIEAQQASAKDIESREPRDLSQMVDQSLKIQMDVIARQSVAIKKKFRAVRPVMASPAKMIHILINLIKNAVEAMDDMPMTDRVLSLEIGESSPSHVFIKVADNGSGIDPEIAPRLFEHGFTTKQGGHGFGLNYCERTVAEMGGRITVESDGHGKGATFTLTLPCSRSAATDAPALATG